MTSADRGMPVPPAGDGRFRRYGLVWIDPSRVVAVARDAGDVVIHLDGGHVLGGRAVGTDLGRLLADLGTEF